MYICHPRMRPPRRTLIYSGKLTLKFLDVIPDLTSQTDLLRINPL